VEYRILGSLQAVSDGTSADLGPPKQRAVLAVLLLHANEIVPVDRLIDLVWPEHAPRTAAHSVQIYVSDLRKTFESLSGAPMIATRPPGYMLEVEPERIDAERFGRLVADGIRRVNNGDRDGGADALRSALALWRGPPLSDFAYEEFAQPHVHRLAKLRLTALEELASAELAHGQPQEAVPLLETAISDDPLRERSRELHMLALYQSGRQAEALRTYQQFRRQLDEELGLDPSPALRRLEEGILLHDPSLLPPAPRGAAGGPARNPYKGLRAFGEDDAGDFFGRETLVNQLVAALTDGARLVALVGPSGSGKSSVIAAGLLPAIRNGAVPGSEAWVVGVMMPGRHPGDELDTALTGPEPGSADGATDAQQRVLVIDQFEEAFSLADEAEQRLFLNRLATLVSASDEQVRVVLTLRADFYGRALLHPEFGRMFTGGVVNVLPMTPDELDAAVAQPARRVGVSMEPGLVTSVVSDAVGQPGSLPLLQFALTDMFDGRSAAGLTLDEYRALGGLRGLLSRRTEAIFARLGAEHQHVALQVFLRMVQLGQGSQVTRRRAPVVELTALEVDPVTLSEVLDEFGRRRLLSFDRDAVTGDATVEVAHEALLTEWPRLAEWVDRYRDDLRRQAALSRAAEDWESSGREPDYLFTGSRLAETEAWRRDTPVLLTAQEQEFVSAGVARQLTAQSDDAARHHEQARLTRRARGRLIALFVVVVLLAGSVTYAVLGRDSNRPPDAVAITSPEGGDFSRLVDEGFREGVSTFDIRADRQILPDEEIEARLASLSDDGVDLMIVLTVNCSETVEPVAASHPDSHYVVFDCTGDVPNVAYTDFATEQGSFLAGAAAALTSQTGVIGYIGGWQAPDIERFQAGYEAGALAVDPTITILSEYLSPPGDPTGFDNEPLAFVLSERMYREGADVVYHAAGSSGLGVFEGAVQMSAELGRRVWAIGVDQDQYAALAPSDPWRQHILTSMTKNYDRATIAYLEEFSKGEFRPGARELNLSNGGVDLATSGGFIDDIQPELERLRRAVVEGEITVPTTPSSRPPS